MKQMKRKQPFMDGWTCKKLGTNEVEAAVRLPHDAMLSEKRSRSSAGGKNTGWYEGGDYRYRKVFFVPEADRNRHILFEFEGVYRNAEVWINGHKAAYYPYGYTGFYVEADAFLLYGMENEIQVIARNSDQPNSRWYTGTGIYRPVWLYILPKEHILMEGIRIRTVNISPAAVSASGNPDDASLASAISAKIEISIDVTGSGTIYVEIMDGETCVARTSTDSKSKGMATILLHQAKLWSPKHPYLYICRVTFGEDAAEETFGIRMLDWNPEKGLSINGERIILRGACIHHDNGILGACCYPEAEERKLRILMENGYNAVRSAHNPCSKAMLYACDRLGMLMMDEYVDVWYIHKTEYDHVNYFKDWWKKDLEAMVRKDYNHPGVILYSIGNEVAETAQEKGIRLTGKMTSYLHELDQTRPVTCGINIFFNLLSSMGFGVYSDQKARKEMDRTGKKKPVGSEFYNTLAGIFGDKAMKLGATLRGCDQKTRGAFAKLDIAGYNYGILRYERDLKAYPKRLILGSETFCKDAWQFWELAKKHPRIIGDFVWAGMDYLGEVAIGSWEYKDYAPTYDGGPGWISAGSGRIDLTGKPLGEALYTRVAMEQAAGPFIAVRPVYQNKRHSPSAWKMTNAMPSWSWRGCEGRQATVEVYARAAKIVIYLNKRCVGIKYLNRDCRAVFRIPYDNGILTAVSCDSHGNEIGRSSLKTAGEETRLRAVSKEQTVMEGGLAFVRLSYTDKEGIVKPMERSILHVTVEGGTLLGLGSACPYNTIGFLKNVTDTYYGEALAVIRAERPGTMRLTVTDKKQSGIAAIQVTEKEERC